MKAPVHKDGLSYYQFSIFDSTPWLRHGVFTRRDGESGDFNLAFGEGFEPAAVMANLGRAEKALGVGPAAFVHQTHGAAVTVVRPEDGYQPRRPEDLRRGFDALAAPRPGVSLLVKLADCQGVLLHDPKSRVLALIHSGWRGSVQNIIGRVAGFLQEEYGVEPAGLLAGVSPSLGPCCAEFKNFRQELPEQFLDYQAAPNHFDFWAISRAQLTAAGLKNDNIEIAGICTKCSPDFFSYRGGDRYGRFGVLAAVADGRQLYTEGTRGS